MAKKFDIHEWQAKQWLKNQLDEQDFTPDLEDDELKRSKIQQMMAKEKGNATPVDGGMNQGDYDKVVDLLDRYSLGELLDAAVEFYQNGGEDESAELANKFATDFRKFLDSKDGELNENEENIPELSDEEKDNLTDMTNEFVRKLTDLRGGNYSGDKLLAALQFVILNVQDMEPMLYTDTDGDGTPDVVDNDEEELNEVDIKRVVDQSMSNDDIGKLMDVIRNNDLGKTLNTIAVIVDQTGGMPEGAAQMIADLVAEIPEGGEEELDEQNVTGGGASFNAGSGGTGAYATPKSFKRKSGYMGYSEPVNEQEEPQEPQSSEEEISKDVEKIENLPALDRVNTKDEWEDLMQVVLDMGDEIRTVTPAAIKMFLTQALKNVNQPK